MKTIAVALPILPGKTEEWRRVVQEATGPRRSEVDDMHSRLNLRRANWFLQQTPHGDLAIVFLEGAGAAEAFLKWAQSSEPFDVWFKEKIGATYGLNLSEPAPGPAPETVYEYRGS
jgi:hypothetical protein